MAESLLGGAAIGAVFGEFLKAVIEMRHRAVLFKPTLAYVATTLTAIEPMIKEIEQQNNQLGRPKSELELLIKDVEEGTKLVYKCSRIHKLNFPARIRCQEQLGALVESLVRFFIIDIQAQNARDLKETLLKVRRIHSAVNKIQLNSNEENGDAGGGGLFPVELNQMDVNESNTSAIQQNYENVTEITDSVPEMAVEPETLGNGSAEQLARLSHVAASQIRTISRKDNDRATENSSMPKLQSQQDNAESTKVEWIEQYQPGVYITITTLPCGKKSITQVRFGRNLFSEMEAEQWWKGNRSRVYRRYEIELLKDSQSQISGGLNPLEQPSIHSIPRTRIIIYEGCPYKFDLEGLLRAPAEVLGETSYATTYKIVLENGKTLVMKKLKDVMVEKQEFEQKIEIVQRISQHPNVLPPLACYCSNDEKLLIYDYKTQGSFSKLLHGENENSEAPPLDWDSRLKISLGVAKGIAHIHSLEGGSYVHGNITSSNVLVTNDHQGCISDLSMTYSVSNSFNQFRNTGYQEIDNFFRTKKRMKVLTQRCDVYSFGVLLFEMLTGRLPSQYINLPASVTDDARDGIYVYDSVIKSNNKKNARKMRLLAESCCGFLFGNVPSMAEVVREMEEIISL